MDQQAMPELRIVARRFIGEVFDQMERENVIPAPRFAPHVRVGRDYFGDSVRSVGSYAALESAIAEAVPEKFAARSPGLPADFPSTYVFSFIDAAVYLCTIDGGGYSTASQAVTEAINFLVSALVDDAPEVAVCRAVTHLTTASEQELVLGDITVTPAIGWDALRFVGQVIPGTGNAVSRDPPFVYDPPGSVITVRGRAFSDPYASVAELSRQLEQFLIAVRLLTCASVQSAVEVRGSTSRVSRIAPHMVEFQFGGTLGSLIRRTARLSPGDEGPIERVTELLRRTAGRRDGVLISSFDMALTLYNRSHQFAPWTDRLVDLATALEASLIGNGDDNSSVLMRLRHRAATLLMSDNDNNSAIHADVKLLYDLRSALVHGGDLTEKKLNKMLRGLSTVPDGTPAGVGAELAVDRLRDLVRRSVLARMSLGSGESPPWPFDKQIDVDALLIDDATRVQWRESWQAHVAEVAGTRVPRRARRAVEALSTDDR